MGRAVLPGKPGIELHLRPSARARRVTLRVSGVDGRVTVSYPERVGADEALRFAEEKADWIEDHLARRPRARVVAPGQRIPIEGVAVEVVAGTGRGARLADGRLSVPAGRPGPAAEAFLKALARDRLAGLFRAATAVVLPSEEEGYGLTITERVPLETVPTAENAGYLATKAAKLGHLIDLFCRWRSHRRM